MDIAFLTFANFLGSSYLCLVNNLSEHTKALPFLCHLYQRTLDLALHLELESGI